MAAAARALAKPGLLALAAAYTAFSAGPFVWLAMLSLRTTQEIQASPYRLPEAFRWRKFVSAWTESNYGTYFLNSVVVVSAAVAIVTLVGAMAAHALARYRFRGNRALYFVLFSSIVLPPQITIIALFEQLIEYELFDTRLGLVLVYVSIQLPLTVYLLESFFARIPNDLYEAARMDGYGDVSIFFLITLPVGLPAIATVVILNFITLWNEFLYAVVLISDDARRTLPLGIQKFLGDAAEDYGMVATGMVIATAPVIVAYALFSEKLIRGMSAGAVK
jgi:multiple sugar transport system permease protein/raffinose/stachyose/melibiose transport system permease protein